jgi:hypothetical protein
LGAFIVSERDAGDRIGAFSIGLALAALCAFLAWLSFGALTMMANPEDDFWALVRERAQSNPALAVVLVLCCAGALFGAVLMCRAALGKRQTGTSAPRQ